MNLTISKSFYKKPIWWIQFIIVFNCIYKALINFVHIPSAINYLNDLAWGILALSMLMNKKKNVFTSRVNFLVLLLFLDTIVGYLINLYQPMIYLWGFRTLFRYFIFFEACTLYASESIVQKILNFLKSMIVVNAIFSTFEMFLGYDMDAVAGLYAAGKNVLGGSAGLNMLMCIVCAYLIVQYIHKEISLWKMAPYVVLCMYMAAIGELKAFFFEFAIIILLSILLTNFSFKKLGIAIAGVMLFGLGLVLYSRFYGNQNDIFSISAMMSYAGIDGSTYGKHLLNRTTALPYIKENFLNTPIKFLFGLGLGFCDSVTLEMFSSGFMVKYGYLGYQYFFSSLEFLNVGAVGLVLYYLFIVFIFFFSRKRMKTCQMSHRQYYALAQVMCLLIIFVSFYNQSLIIDVAAFNAFFVLAIPFIISKSIS